MPADANAMSQYVCQLGDNVAAGASTEERLRQEKALLEGVVETSPVGIITVAAHGRLVSANAAAERILGISRDEACKRNFAAGEWHITSPEGLPFPTAQLPAAIALTEGRSVLGVEFCVVRADGQRVLLSVSAAPIRDAAGKVDRAVTVFEDISERRRDEQARQQVQARLHETQKLEMIGTLAGGIAHDFNNLLSGILGNASLLELALEKDPESCEHLRDIQKLVERGAGLTRQLLGFARRGKYDPRPLQLNAVIERMATLHGHSAQSIAILVVTHPDLPLVEVDRTQFEQALLNLIINGFDAMPNGGTLSLSTGVAAVGDAQAIQHHVSPGSYVKVNVVDTGTGIDAATMAKLFQPFFTTKGIGRGTGLGLASVRGIVENHGGFVEVHSQVGRGATFSLYLPVAKVQTVAPEVVRTSLRRGTETLLIVDDEEPILRVTSKLLGNLGYTVLTAKTGVEAVALFRESEQKIALVILDMVMPGMNGQQVFEALRALDPNVNVLLASGYSVEGQATELLRAGCRGFIQKPFDVEALSNRLRELLPPVPS